MDPSVPFRRTVPALATTLVALLAVAVTADAATRRTAAQRRVQPPDAAGASPLAAAATGLETGPAAQRERAEPAPIGACTEVETWIEASVRDWLESADDPHARWWSTSGPSTTRPGEGDCDIVAVHENYLYTLSGTSARILRALPGTTLLHVATVDVEGAPLALHVAGGHLTVVSSVTSWPWFWWEPRRALAGVTKLTTWDVSLPGRPLFVREDWFDGRLLSARPIGERILLVLDHLPLGVPGPPTADEEAWKEGVMRQVQDTTLDHWLPQVLTRHPDMSFSRRRLLRCEGIERGTPLGLRMTVVVAVSPSDGATEAAAVASSAPTVVGGSGGVALVAVEGGDHAIIHQFADAGRPGLPLIAARGSVPGAVVSPESLDVRDGVVRVVTRVEDAGVTSTSLHLLEPDGSGQLDVVGKLDGIGTGEIPRAVRFAGERAYVVAFPELDVEPPPGPPGDHDPTDPEPPPPPPPVDPVFAIDLSQPASPRILGETLLTGFSQSLHLLADGRLLGVGSEIDPATGTRTGVKVSLFDVSGDGAPVLVDSEVILQATSLAETSLQAVGVIESEGWVTIPVSVTGQPHAELVSWRLGQGGLDLLGRMSMSPLPSGADFPRRTLVLDRRVLAVAGRGIVVSRAGDPATAGLIHMFH